MVKKLFKHEILSYLRILPIVYIVLLGMAGLNRFIQIFESDTVIFKTVMISSSIVFFLAIVASFILTQILAIVRFYKNMFSNEGYLTFTLPVKVSHHLIVKLTCAVLSMVSTFVVTLISIFIVLTNNFGVELVKATEYMLNEIPKEIATHLPFYLIEYLVLILLSVATSLLLFYTCMTIGQLAKKNRILLSVGVYIGYTFVMQFVSSFLSVGINVFGILTNGFEPIIQALTEYPLTAVHVFLAIFIFFTLISATIYYVITYNITKKKLNLE